MRNGVEHCAWMARTEQASFEWSSPDDVDAFGLAVPDEVWTDDAFLSAVNGRLFPDDWAFRCKYEIVEANDGLREIVAAIHAELASRAGRIT